MTGEPVGPAVFGLIRPTIVLPAEVVAARSPAHLGPILAHELSHVLRGDLWIGLLQLIVGAAWWCYPPVWIAIRRTSRTSEECCDHAVVTALPGSRRAYADLLLEFLARGHSLRAFPFAPGMKPAEITFRRMERIMTMRTKANRWAVCLRWMLLLGAGVVVLPGAGRGEAPEQADSSRAATSLEEVLPVVAAEPQSAVSDEHLVIVYVLDGVFERLEIAGINKKGAERMIAELFRGQENAFEVIGSTTTESPTTDEVDSAIYLFDDGKAVVKSVLRFTEKGAVVYAARSHHEHFNQLLKGLGFTGAGQVDVQFQNIMIGSSELDEFVEWNSAGEYVTSVATPTKNDSPGVVGRAEVKYAIIDPETLKAIKEAGDVVSSPTVELFNGESAVIGEHTKREVPVEVRPGVAGFLTGIHGWKSTISVSVQPDAEPDRDAPPLAIGGKTMKTATLHLDSVFVFSHLDTSHEPYDADDKSRQRPGVPYIRTRFAEINIPVPLGKTVIIQGRSLYGPPIHDSRAHPVAITITNQPTEVWHHVGTDEFRIEPAE